MDKTDVTLIAALIASLTSIVTLGLNARLAIFREKRMILWSSEVQRLNELEEIAGTIKETAQSHASPEALKEEFPPLHEKLKLEAGRFARYPKLANAIRDLNQACAATYSDKIDRVGWQESSQTINPAFSELLACCDMITKRKKT